MIPRRLAVLLGLWLAFVVTPVAAQTTTCDALTGAKRDVALAVLKSQRPYDCCSSTIYECLKKKPACSLVVRLANDVCRQAGAGKGRAEIERELLRRAASRSSSKQEIDLSHAVVAGDPSAPVEIVVYVCARCPYCAKLTPALHHSVTAGKLKGKAKLYIRPFPIRSHEGSTVAGMAWLAAQRLGKFWEMVLHMYKTFDRFDPSKLPDCAAHQGMDREAFSKLLKDPGLRKQLVESKKEGIRNHVTATPTIFVERRKYQANLDTVAVEDFVMEVLEAKR
jgi:protein-disulfide isomerase